MKSLTRLAVTGLAVTGLAVTGLAITGVAAAVTAAATTGSATRATAGAVFVQTDNLAGNQVVAYRRAANGTLTQAGVYSAGGLGGQLAGSAVDHLASQGSLTYDRVHALLYAVNAGSNTLAVFAVAGDRLTLRQVVGSGGAFPVSVAAHGDLVYVANARGGGSLQGYRVIGGRLAPIPGSRRPLHLDTTLTPEFTNTPGQVAFSPGGRQLIVTTKANGNDIDVFGVLPAGLLTAPVVTTEAGTTPFGIAFDPAGHLVIAEAGPSALATFTLLPGGRLVPIAAVPDGQAALCWVTSAGPFLFADNAGSASTSGYRSLPGGGLALLGATGTDPGTVDPAATPDGRFLYVQTGGNGLVDAYSVAASGALTEVGHVVVPGAVGGEGIVAS